MTTATITQCTECDDPLSDEEIEYPTDKGEGPICTNCECANHHWTCEFCQNCEEDDYIVEIFAVYDGDEAEVPVGIYRILRRPFYYQGMLGGGGVFPDCVERVADLPQGQECEQPCAFLCRDCAKPYQQAEVTP